MGNKDMKDKDIEMTPEEEKTETAEASQNDAGESEKTEDPKKTAESDNKEDPKKNGDSDKADAAEEKAEEDSSEQPEPSAGAKENPKDKDKKKIFGRKKEKKDKKDEKIEELTDRLTRQLAEFDNYRKRTEKEKAANYIVGAKEVIEKMLPVVDNFERGLANANPEDPFVEGINKIYKQLTQILTDIGVTPIEAVGKPFDPNFHNAVMQVEDENFGENTVCEEFQKGYMYKDQVIRFSMVKVAN